MKGVIATVIAAALGVTAASPTPVRADDFPTKSVRFIVPYPPGGGADIVARLVSAKLGEELGQPVVVDNKPGATTVIGTEALAHAPPDGYTIGMITEAHVINPQLMKQLPYDSKKDFAPVSQLVNLPMMLVANPALHVTTVAELIAAAKAKPGKINYASTGNGSPHYLAMEWFKVLAGIDMNHIAYKGVAPALNDVVADHVDVMFSGTSSGMPYVKSGKLVGLAISSAKREAVAPGVPAVAESPGMQTFDYVSWYGVAAPDNTPRAIIERLSSDIAKTLNAPDVKDKLNALGNVGAPSTPEQFKVFLDKEDAKFADMIRRTGAKLD